MIKHHKVTVKTHISDKCSIVYVYIIIYVYILIQCPLLSN